MEKENLENGEINQKKAKIEYIKQELKEKNEKLINE